MVIDQGEIVQELRPMLWFQSFEVQRTPGLCCEPPGRVPNKAIVIRKITLIAQDCTWR